MRHVVFDPFFESCCGTKATLARLGPTAHLNESLWLNSLRRHSDRVKRGTGRGRRVERKQLGLSERTLFEEEQKVCSSLKRTNPKVYLFALRVLLLAPLLASLLAPLLAPLLWRYLKKVCGSSLFIVSSHRQPSAWT